MELLKKNRNHAGKNQEITVFSNTLRTAFIIVLPVLVEISGLNYYLNHVYITFGIRSN